MTARAAGTVTITGGSGFVGRLVRRGLEAEGYDVRVFDQYRGALVDLLRHRFLAEVRWRPGRGAARVIRGSQRPAEAGLRRVGAIRRRPDDICAGRDVLAESFRGSSAVIHLAGIPHPTWPGATEEDFVRLNYDAAIDVFEAAREAGARTFVFASSAQVYRINDPVRIDQLPILESNYLPDRSEGQSAYGFLKAEFERYLAGAVAAGRTQAVSLRLEYPGFRSRTPANLYVSTSVENLVAGFSCALRPPGDLGFEAFNLADAEVDPQVVDVQSYIRSAWPDVPNHTVGNECLLGTEKARRLLGYRPASGGTYINPALVW